MRGSVLTLALLTAACVHKPVFDTYRLRGPVLVPPGVPGPEVVRRTLVSDIAPGNGSCTGEAPMLQLRKKRLVIAVDRDSLLQQKQPGWLSNWTMQAEAHGCIAQGEGTRLANLIADSVPLDSQIAFRLLHPNDVQSGYVELGAENRLEVRSPIGAGPLDTAAVTGSGAQLTVDLKAPAIAGFEIAWYALRPNPGRGGFHFEPLYADRTTRNGVEHLTAPAVNYFQFPPQAAFYRLFYKTDDNGVTAIVISGVTRQDLDRRTKAVGADASACENAGGLCVVLPRRAGVNPFLVVTVNDKELTVPLGGTVRGAIQTAGQRPETVLATLTVSRLYSGQLRSVEFDRASPEILNLKLGGGEHLAW
ncbi:MAG: hypothetical protein P4L56_18295 [Candidatus Sulfopaludibacter sp.]|nr:hypothetical protein [Candidatus Sulfopaludibacter sp.]